MFIPTLLGFVDLIILRSRFKANVGDHRASFEAFPQRAVEYRYRLVEGY